MPVISPQIADNSDRLSLRAHLSPLPQRLASGKDLRKSAPRASHAEWSVTKQRDPVAIVLEANEGRVTDLVPIRMGRMAASPFAFYRGSANLMAFDLSQTLNSGLSSWICGDAHLSNFGIFASPEQLPVFDLNDFDETTVGPWEWDVKRLAASIVLAGRERKIAQAQLNESVVACTRAYRLVMTELSTRKLLDAYRVRWRKGDLKPYVSKESRQMFAKVIDKAQTRTNDKVLTKLTVLDGKDGWRFEEQPPLLTRAERGEIAPIVEGLEQYADTLLCDRRDVLNAYGIQDIAFKVVGVGSVGTRAYVVMLTGNGKEDALFLQLKEAPGSQLTKYLPAPTHKIEHEGERVVTGQRTLQALTDPFLGWTSIGGRAFYVRQLKDMKGSVDTEKLNTQLLHDYALLLGGTLAMAHGRTNDPALIAGYLGKSERFGQAIAKFADSYADQVEADYAQFNKAIKTGKIHAEMGV